MILSLSIFSLIIIFPRFYEKEENKIINSREIIDARNLCIALCEYVKSNITEESVCLSDKDTITGVYWKYKDISCFVSEKDNPCIEKGKIEIILDLNCNYKEYREIK
ncbi:MAG: hypothetical protein QXP34_03550 [Candidatus Aenigmatarchaeota archaeon]